MTPLALALGFALALAACAPTEELSPAPLPARDAGADAAPAPEPAVVPWVKRTVETRNPYGGPAGNLLADGDFEFSTVAQQGAQLGWRAYTSDGKSTLNILTETGGLCRSGLRCALFQPGMLLLLRGTAANGQRTVASIHGKMPAGQDCFGVRPILIDCDTFDVHLLLANEAKPGPDGWCRYAATVAPDPSALCLYVDNTLSGETYALMDSAVMSPDDGTVYPDSVSAWVPDAELASTLASLRDTVRRTTRLDRAPRGAPRPEDLR